MSDKIGSDTQGAKGEGQSHVPDQDVGKESARTTTNGVQEKPAIDKPEWAYMYDMKPHPLASAFPFLTDEQMQELVDDIKKNGLRHPIITFDGMVLDGQNRLKACELAGVRPQMIRFEDIKGNTSSPVEYVISQNLRRRHLDTTARAMAAAAISQYQEQHSTGSANGDANLHQGASKHTGEDASKMMKVSERSGASARKVLKKGVPELVEAVNSGGVAVSAAAVVADLPPEQQKLIVADGKDAIRDKAAEMREGKKKGSNRREKTKDSAAKADTTHNGIRVNDKPDSKLEQLLQQGWMPLTKEPKDVEGRYVILLALPRVKLSDKELKAFVERNLDLQCSMIAAAGLYSVPQKSALKGDVGMTNKLCELIEERKKRLDKINV
ncbi:MAG: ParB N-terminal domain-containing protein [Planctomycetota bacterium]